MNKNTKVLLLAGAVTLIVIVLIVAAIIALRPFFNIANVVSGGH
jgi:hypothetical protein